MLDRRGGGPPSSTTLVDILDKVLDKGLVVAGDIRVSVANVELLTIQIRLLVCSIDKAQEIGLDWWRHDSFLSAGGDRRNEVVDALQERIHALEQRLAPAGEVSGPETEPGAQDAEPDTGNIGPGRRGTGRRTRDARHETRDER